MSYTVVYSNYNGYPGSRDTYDFRGARETPILPDVNLYNSFNFKLYATTANANAPSTQESGAGSYGRGQSWRVILDQALVLGIHIMHTSALMLRGCRLQCVGFVL